MNHANDNLRSPTEHRAAVDAWRATAPGDDGDIWPRKADSSNPRHSSLSDDLMPLLWWRSLRELAEQSGGGSTWMSPGGNEGPTEAEPRALAEWSAEALILAASAGVRWRQLGGRLIPSDGDLETSPISGRLVRCGRLVLADDLRGDNDNEAPEDVSEEAGEPLDLVDILAGRNVQRDRSYNREHPAGSIVAIVHRTRDGRLVRLSPPTEPGYRNRSSAPPPAAGPGSLGDTVEARDLLARLLASLGSQTVAILDIGMRAENFRDIGEMLGKAGKHAERVGKRALLVACRDLQAVLRALEMPVAA